MFLLISGFKLKSIINNNLLNQKSKTYEVQQSQNTVGVRGLDNEADLSNVNTNTISKKIGPANNCRISLI